MYKIMDGNEACSYVSYNFSELAGIYPITPASPMAEYIDKWANEKKENFFGFPVKVVQMESEAGAIGAVHGALQNGILATTYTASQGLLLMIPNMYKIAGEMLPCVINVAARSLATHALSILGDHQDIYATRQTGFAMLALSSVQQVMDLTSVSYLSALKGRIPFLNFFDGFRTSHELQKIELIDIDKVKQLIDKKALIDFRKRALSINNVTRGTNENDDIYFQITEARNKYYNALPDIVDNYMQKINEITGNDYKPFNYYGDKAATKVIVAMGSVCETIKETVDILNQNNKKVGLIEVHLYRPFSSKYFFNVLPKSVKSIAVLDRTKEPGSKEPLYLDVSDIVKESNRKIKVIGGRYGLSSKNTTPDHINSVFEFLDIKDNFNGFTIGIDDDVTNLSLKPVKLDYKNPNYEILIYGFGSDGMVSVSKDILKIIGNNTKAFTQGYFEYDSKKSGGVTKCHIRLGNNKIRSTYYVENPTIVVCTKDTYLKKFNMLDNIVENGIFILNTSKTKEQILEYMDNNEKEILKKRHIRFYIINANKIAIEEGLNNKINTIMATIIFKIGKLIDFNFAINEIKKSLETLLTNKGKEIIEKNIKAIDRALETLENIEIENIIIKNERIIKNNKSVFELINERKGNSIPISKLEPYVDGTFEGGYSKNEKKDITEFLPCYNKENCIMCNQCALVCPHGVIRPFLVDDKEEKKAPESLKKDLKDSLIKDKNLKFVIGVNMDNCTGCGLCSNVCPGKNNEKALIMKPTMEVKNEENIEKNNYLFEKIKEKKIMSLNTIKGSQFAYPKFEFSGACAGCGETPYLKLLTQLFGSELVIANATGCSSIYGGSIPSTSYSVPWANSLFEDNAEFGFGMALADKVHKERIKNAIYNNLKKIPNEYKEIFASYYKKCDYESSCLLYEVIEKTKIKELIELKPFIKTKSFWIVGGDGWAYDIGYNGLDHVLSTKENINILVLDTEVYSNTGGQSSKSSKIGSVAKFASTGKTVAKKDLAKIALAYSHVYVATVSLGANMMQTIKAFTEAKNYNGPSLIIAYSPCIAQGIKLGMTNSIQEEKKATESGYFPIFRYSPETKEFSLDSKADFSKYSEFLDGETRYSSLAKVNPDKKDDLYEQNQKNAEERYKYYESLTNKNNN